MSAATTPITAPRTHIVGFALWTVGTTVAALASWPLIVFAPIVLYYAILFFPIFGLFPCTSWPDCSLLSRVNWFAVDALFWLVPSVLAGLLIGTVQARLLGLRVRAAGLGGLIMAAGLTVAHLVYWLASYLINFRGDLAHNTAEQLVLLAGVVAGALTVGTGRAKLLHWSRPATLIWTLMVACGWLLGGIAIIAVAIAGDFFLMDDELWLRVLLVGACVSAVATGLARLWLAGERPPGVGRAVAAAGITVVVSFSALGSMNYAKTIQTQRELDAMTAEFLASLPKWGPDYATPGMALTLTEVARTGSAGATTVTYAVSTSGLPRDQTYTLWQLPPYSHPQLPLKGDLIEGDVLRFGDDGQLVSQLSNAAWDSVQVEGYAKGQRYDIALMNDDESIRVFARVMPFPVEVVGTGTCRLWLELASPIGSRFLLGVEGFEPGETVKTHSQVLPAEEPQLSAYPVDDNGRTAIWLSEWVFGDDSGRTAVTVTGQSCEARIEYDWGVAAMAPQ